MSYTCINEIPKRFWKRFRDVLMVWLVIDIFYNVLITTNFVWGDKNIFVAGHSISIRRNITEA